MNMMRNCARILNRCFSIRYIRIALFCALVVYITIMLYAYEMIENLPIGASESNQDYLDAHTVQGVENLTTIRDNVLPKPRKVFNIWPLDNFDKGDRIISQLEFAHAHKNEFQDSKWKFIHTDSIINQMQTGREAFTVDECPIDTCYLVLDRRQNLQRVNENISVSYDAVMTTRNIIPNVPKNPDAVVIFFNLESPLHGAGPRWDVNWTATYRSSSTIHSPYEFFVENKLMYNNRTVRNYAKGKSKMAAAFMSHCQTRNNRTTLVEELQKYITIDVYGQCGSFKCPRSTPKTCFGVLNTHYKFYLSFENSNCREYITEKFFVNGLRLVLLGTQFTKIYVNISVLK